MIRKARLDKNIKAIVLRINSGGGSALASENIWRELTLAKVEKPLVVSFGDVAASGGYYIAAAADSIFAQPIRSPVLLVYSASFLTCKAFSIISWASPLMG
jgi:protease-4